MKEIIYNDPEITSLTIDEIAEEVGKRILVLIDIDGTVSSTPDHMKGLNSRLSDEFPQIAEVLPQITERRSAFRKEYGHLSFTEQDEIWQRLYPGTTSHSQLDTYKTFAPEVFDEVTTAAVDEWVTDPDNFGFAEYDDVEPMFAGLQEVGAHAVLFTLGQYTRADGKPGWQQLKIHSSPRLRELPSHIAEILPEGGKGQVIAEAYSPEESVFNFPLTDGSKTITADRVIMVDDSIHNIAHLPEQAVGVLIDRKGKHANWAAPANVRVVQSLEEVPAIVAELNK